MTTRRVYEDEDMSITLRMLPVRPTDTHISYELDILEPCGCKLEKTVKGTIPFTLTEEHQTPHATPKDELWTDEDYTESPLFAHFKGIFHRIDQSKYATQRAEHVLELLHFCGE